MTVIAYKDGILASDSRLTAGSLICGTDRKIARVDGYMVGGTGNSEDWEIFLEWFGKTIKNPLTPKPVPLNKSAEFIAIKNRKIIYYGSKLIPFNVKSKFHAMGSGMDLAYGAMAMGASAVKAVEIACKFNKDCGPPIQWMSKTQEHVEW